MMNPDIGQEQQPCGFGRQNAERTNFSKNVFKMLYQAENPVAEIHTVLELVGRHFSFERGYVFETSKDGRTTSNTFEWCAKGIAPQIKKHQKIPIDADNSAYLRLQSSGMFCLNRLEELPPSEHALLELRGIRSMYQFGIFDKRRLLGFIGFDNYTGNANQGNPDVEEVKTVCNILATFFARQYIDEAFEKELLARQEVMNHLENYIYVINVETFELLFMNEKIQTLLNKSEKETACYSFFRGKSAQCADCPVGALIHDNTDSVVLEMYNDKLKIWMETAASLMRWSDGSLACLVICSDITKQKQDHISHINQLERLTCVDTLTGGRTYHKFQIDAQQILAKWPDKIHALVKLDINNFKLINQIYGYEKGNEILYCVAKAMEQSMRSEDDIFARVANDEFIALFTIRRIEEIEGMIKRFLGYFYCLVGEEFSFRFEFPHGRYMIEQGSAEVENMNAMFEKVNIAHKTAKLDKTVQFLFYDERMTKEALRVKEIENKMVDALNGEEFLIYLQPKYYLKNESMGGAEALTRWGNSNTDLFYPSAFIPVFEQNGFITRLDFYVFEKVCGIIKSWVDSKIEPAVVSVNFSRQHLGDTDFVKKLCEIVDNAGIDRKYVEIEITETVIYDNIQTLEILLADIHKSGFSMSMDDFGSGYSSLGMLKNFPVDVIKMDRSFFADQRELKRSKTIVGSIIQMAAGLGIRIVAEGVEEQEQIDFLRELNCDMVQGYYYAKPMPVCEFTQLLHGKKV